MEIKANFHNLAVVLFVFLLSASFETAAGAEDTTTVDDNNVETQTDRYHAARSFSKRRITGFS
jgi:hypothetical protein